MGATVDVGEEAGEGRGVVAGESPEAAAGGDVAAYATDEVGEEGEEEEADGAGFCGGGLAVDFGEGEKVGAGEDGGEVGDAVEDGD